MIFLLRKVKKTINFSMILKNENCVLININVSRMTATQRPPSENFYYQEQAIYHYTKGNKTEMSLLLQTEVLIMRDLQYVEYASLYNCWILQ